MRYVSILGDSPPLSFAEAVMRGVTPAGGMFVPEHIPQIDSSMLAAWASLAYAELAAAVLRLFVAEEDLSQEALVRICTQSFGGHNVPHVVESSAAGHGILEMYHGDTLAFKDLGMAVLLRLIAHFHGAGHGAAPATTVNVVVATSGDTGPAAAAAALGLAGVHLWLLYPERAVSTEQELQMTAGPVSRAANISVVRVGGGATSDTIDRVPAALFADASFAAAHRLTTVNSTNVARVLVQAVHFVYSFLHTSRRDADGRHLTCVIPTGACGNLLGGVIARLAGVPLHFVIATNANDVMVRFATRGVLDATRVAQPTMSNAIDIAVPYNVWRLVFFTAARGSAERTAELYAAYARDGGLALDDSALAALRERGGITGAYAIDDAETLGCMRRLWEHHSLLVCPHTAVAICAAERHAGAYALCLATAHPAKFARAVTAALAAPYPRAWRHARLDALASGDVRVRAARDEDDAERWLRAHIGQSPPAEPAAP